MKFKCPHCNHLIHCPDTASGKKGRCPTCKEIISVPKPQSKWYYVHNHQRSGPVSKEALARMVKLGRLQEDDLIWSKTIGDRWVKAWKIKGLFDVPTSELSKKQDMAKQKTSAGSEDSEQNTAPLPNLNTGRMRLNNELMLSAKEKLQGKWGLAAGVTAAWMGIIIVLSFIPILGSIAVVVINGPLLLGYTLFLFSIRAGEEATVSQLFSEFSNFIKPFTVFLLIMAVLLVTSLPGSILITFLPFILGPGNEMLTFLLLPVALSLFFPMIYAQYALYMSFFILAEDTSIGSVDILKKSYQLMKGRKLKLFGLQLRFTGWVVLGSLLLGIPLLWIIPYMQLSAIEFYKDISS